MAKRTSRKASLGSVLPARWTKLDYHEGQEKYYASQSRFIINCSGRRSGKSEIAKRKGVDWALEYNKTDSGLFVFGAPTYTQAKNIFWADLKKLVPKWAIKVIREGELTIELVTGTRLVVIGMDAPDRIEGQPIDFILLDEFGNMRDSVWTENIRPAIATKGRPGRAMFIGVPEGRNHYWDLYQRALLPTTPEDLRDVQKLDPSFSDVWEVHHWPTWEILDEEEVRQAEKELDELTFRQEFGGEFVSFAGRAYYKFLTETHANEALYYDTYRPLYFCFDFNVDPGVCAIIQELEYQGDKPNVAPYITSIIGEVFIERNSNTPAVCRKLIQDWKDHQGKVICYGDHTGGNRGTAKVQGSDWDLVREYLLPAFGDRLHFSPNLKYKKNPRERARINTTNSRLQTSDGIIHMKVDPFKAPNIVRDFEGTALLKGGSGEIDKRLTPDLTHLTDGIGYYLVDEHPLPGYETYHTYLTDI